MARHIRVQVADGFDREIRLQPRIAGQAQACRNPARGSQHRQRCDHEYVVLCCQREELFVRHLIRE